jgi:hypothetical protein
LPVDALRLIAFSVPGIDAMLRAETVGATGTAAAAPLAAGGTMIAGAVGGAVLGVTTAGRFCAAQAVAVINSTASPTEWPLPRIDDTGFRAFLKSCGFTENCPF